MREIINWCNINNGFLTAILSVISLLLSLIAIFVSLQTARLPYKKKMKLSATKDIAFSKDINTQQVISSVRGISVNAANIGSRNIYITYLGIVVKDKSLNDGQNKMVKIEDEITGTGMIAAAEIKSELYKTQDLLFALFQVESCAKVYLFAQDSEGKQYYKRLGYASDMIKSLSH